MSYWRLDQESLAYFCLFWGPWLAQFLISSTIHGSKHYPQNSFTFLAVSGTLFWGEMLFIIWELMAMEQVLQQMKRELKFLDVLMLLNWQVCMLTFWLNRRPNFEIKFGLLIMYSRVHISSDTAFLKIVKKPSIVQE